jgi:hypothetical protein
MPVYGASVSIRSFQRGEAGDILTASLIRKHGSSCNVSRFCARGQPSDRTTGSQAESTGRAPVGKLTVRQLWQTHSSVLPLSAVLGLWIGIRSTWNLEGTRGCAPTGGNWHTVIAGFSVIG